MKNNSHHQQSKPAQFLKTILTVILLLGIFQLLVYFFYYDLITPTLFSNDNDTQDLHPELHQRNQDHISNINNHYNGNQLSEQQEQQENLMLLQSKHLINSAPNYSQQLKECVFEQNSLLNAKLYDQDGNHGKTTIKEAYYCPDKHSCIKVKDQQEVICVLGVQNSNDYQENQLCQQSQQESDRIAQTSFWSCLREQKCGDRLNECLIINGSIGQGFEVLKAEKLRVPIH